MKFSVFFLLVFILSGFESVCAQEWVYSVRPGDNLRSIAKRYLKNTNDWRRVQTLNGISNQYKIPVGKRLRIPFDWLKWQPIPAKVIAVIGDSFVISPPASEKKKIVMGSELHSGDIVQTSDNANVVLEFADESQLFIRAQSEVVLDSVSVFHETGMVDTHLRLKRGSVENKVKPQNDSGSRYRITTPPGTAAVRGTVFRVSTDAEIMRSEVLKGGVHIATDVSGPVVSAGFGLRAKSGEPLPAPVKLLTEPDLSAVVNSFVRKSMLWQWPPLAGAVSYRVQVAANDSFQALLLDQLTHQSSIEVSGLEDGQYAMRVRGVDEFGLDGMDKSGNFSLSATAVTPAPASVQGGVSLSLGRLGFNWTQPGSAAAFHFQLATDDKFKQLLIDQDQLESNHFRLSQQLSQGRYYWRVSGLNQVGQESVFCKVQSFTVGTITD